MCYTLATLGFVRMWVRSNSSISGANLMLGMLNIDASTKNKEERILLFCQFITFNHDLCKDFFNTPIMSFT